MNSSINGSNTRCSRSPNSGRSPDGSLKSESSNTRKSVKKSTVASPVINIHDIIEALDMTGFDDHSCAFLDTKTGDIVWHYDDESLNKGMNTVSSSKLERSHSRYLALPDRYEINEYHMMEVFACDYDDSGRLARAISGRGAFRYFRDTVDELGLNQEWDEFRSNCYRERAVSWCHGSGLEFKE